jgi:GrpB-like predicted nucleotidyltransferase (UPF0157 family)
MPPDVLSRLRALCLALPEVEERLSHGECAWFVRGKRMFVTLADRHHDDRVACWLAAPSGLQEALVRDRPERFFRPPYVGHRGWLGVVLEGPVDWDEVAELVHDAYATVAPTGLAASVVASRRVAVAMGGAPAARVTVEPYDPAWPARFAQVRDAIAPALQDVAVAIEHVGSTAVPGLAAKPIVDVDVVVEDVTGVRSAIERLEGLGYRHRGDLGIAGREAFDEPSGSAARRQGAHHLYVCLRGGVALENHLRLRDRLRADPELATAYGELKRGLARAHPNDVDAYAAAKTAFVIAVLREAGMEEEDLASIAAANVPT